jgi:4-amino-4-deoxy-L-arabinose transferase-like glycosyltransferase
VLILALIGAPLTLWATRNRWKTRLTHLAIIGVAGAAVISPWTIRNFVQFEEPVYLSTGLDVTMAVTNCDQAYHGQFRAFWYMPCVQFDNPPSGDLSQQAVVYRHRALDYMGDHKGELPALFAARVGRMWGFYRPLQQNHLDVIEGHEIWVSRLALGWFYVLLPAAGVGIVLLRKRRIPIAPMLAPVIVVTISAVITFGNTRYRAAAEITLAVAAAVAFVALGEWWVRRRDGGAPPEPVPPADDEPVLASIG